MGPALRKTSLAFGALVFSLLLVEGTLHLASLFVGARRGGGWLEGSRVHVLCIGDSNTYGLSVRDDESWPARVQQIWEQHAMTPAIDVVNIGFPGTNSSQVLRDFDRNLELFEPDVIVLKIGVNDFWTLPVGTSATGSESVLAKLKRWSRLYRLYYIATRDPATRIVNMKEQDAEPGRGRGELEFLGQTFELGFDKTVPADNGTLDRLLENLRHIVALARRRGVLLVLANYASAAEFYRISNGALARVARETKTPLADVQKVFRNPSLCPREPCPKWIFPDDHPAAAHPTAEGYKYVAQAVIKTLRSALLRQAK